MTPAAFAWLPDGLSPLAAAAVVIASAFTAGLTAAVGLGGGIVLLAVMSALMPPPAVIPVHGAAQFSANASRFALHWTHASWRPLVWFTGGAILGAALGGQVVVSLPPWLLRGAVGVFVLYSQWGPMPTVRGMEARTFAGVGFVGTFLTLFFGATGPFVASALSALKVDREVYAATHAGAMVVQHGLKIAVFGLVGFAYADWASLILAVVAAGFAGTWVGARLLRATPEARFQRVFRWAVTILGVNLLVQAGWGALGG